MPSVSNFQTALEGTLVVQITAAATTATVKVKKINGATPTWLTTAHRITILQKSKTTQKVEVVDVAAGTTQSGTTVTLGTMTRGLPLDGTGFTGTGTPQVFTSGARVIISWDAQAGRQTMFKDIANTLTGSGAIRSTSTTTPIIRLNNVTTAERDLMSASNGDKIYNTTTGTEQTYKGGSWTDVGDTGTADASTTVAGKVEIATAAQRAAATATGETGAVLVPSNDALVKTSSGAGDENKIPVLNSSGQIASGFIPTVPVTKGGTGLTTGTTAYAPIFTGTTATGNFQAGTAGTANQVLTSNGAAAIATFQDVKAYSKFMVNSGGASTTLTNPTVATDFDTYLTTIPANFLVNGTGGRFKLHGTINRGTTTTCTVNFILGSTTMIVYAFGSAGAGAATFIIEGSFHGSAAAGASVAVKNSGHAIFATSSILLNSTSNSVATNGTLAAKFNAIFGTSNGGNDITINSGYIELFSTTPSSFA
jgi:hypothetical protein